MSANFPYLSRKLVTEPFQERNLLEAIWTQNWGADNPIGQIRKALMHRPGSEVFRLHQPDGQVEAGPALLNYISGKSKFTGNTPLNLDALLSQHEALTASLEQEGVQIIDLEGDSELWPEAMFTRDSAMIVPGGAILSRYALYLRYGETRLAAHTLGRIGMPILGMLQGSGLAEGGSFIMLDGKTAIIGRSERVNPEGIYQLKQYLSWQSIDLIVIDLPGSIIHLDEAFLMVDRNKALVNIAYLPYWFLDELQSRGIQLLHVDPRDPMLTINGLTISPGRMLISSAGKYTIELLSHHDINVIPVEVSEIQKLGGGIHCCTLPLIREPLQ